MAVGMTLIQGTGGNHQYRGRWQGRCLSQAGVLPAARVYDANVPGEVSMTPSIWGGIVAAVLTFLGVIGAAYLSARNSLTGKLLEENRVLQRETSERTDRLQERLSQMEATVTSLRQENLQSTSELISVRRENTELQSSNRRLTVLNEALTHDNEDVRQINRDLQESILQVERQNTSVMHDMTDMRERNALLEGQMLSLRRRVEQVGGNVDVIG